MAFTFAAFQVSTCPPFPVLASADTIPAGPQSSVCRASPAGAVTLNSFCATSSSSWNDWNPERYALSW